MDFSSILAREISHKRKTARNHAVRKRPLSHVKADVQDESPPNKPEILGDESKPSATKSEVDHGSHINKIDSGNALEPKQSVPLTDISDTHMLYNQQQTKENAVPDLFDPRDTANEQSRDKVATQCRKYIKSLLVAWTDEVHLSPDSQPSASLLKETKKDLVPLLYKLRTDTLHNDLLTSLATTLFYLQTNNLVAANDAYMKMSLGNVVWPIGIVGVGIKESTTTKHANVMVDDATRRWITAIKRLITRREEHVTLYT